VVGELYSPPKKHKFCFQILFLQISRKYSAVRSSTKTIEMITRSKSNDINNIGATLTLVAITSDIIVDLVEPYAELVRALWSLSRNSTDIEAAEVFLAVLFRFMDNNSVDPTRPLGYKTQSAKKAATQCWTTPPLSEVAHNNDVHVIASSEVVSWSIVTEVSDNSSDIVANSYELSLPVNILYIENGRKQ